MVDSVFSDHNYIEYQPGSSNLILTAPHGGNLRPASIPDRDAGADGGGGQVVYSHGSSVVKDHHKYSVRYKDTFTQELALLLAAELERLSGRRPHVVLCHLYRGKLDANCDLAKAAFGVGAAEEAWYAWHGFIDQAKARVAASGQRGLLLDIHGHRHAEDWVELGYTLTAAQLNEGSFTADQASVRGLLEENGVARRDRMQEVISGDRSLGGILSRYHYKVVPSTQYPTPGAGNYYTGGYNTVYHGSQNGGHIDAIQLENPKSLRNAKAAPAYAKSLAASLVEYITLYYKNR